MNNDMNDMAEQIGDHGAAPSEAAPAMARTQPEDRAVSAPIEQPELSLSEQLMHSTVRIECADAQGQRSSGTGFFFRLFAQEERGVPVIVTNKHVIAGKVIGWFHLTLAQKDRPAYGQKVQVEVTDFDQRWFAHPDPTVDLAICPCADVLYSLDQRGQKPFWVSLDPSLIWTEDRLRNLTPIEEVVMIGYPNGIWDSRNNLPIFRRGITATPVYIDWEGRPEFIVDAAVFPGSSGSPVCLLNTGSWPTRNGGLAMGNRIALLGVVHSVMIHRADGEIRLEQAPTAMKPVPVSSTPNNLGICLKAERILDFEPLLVSRGLAGLPPGYVMRSKWQAPPSAYPVSGGTHRLQR